MAESMTDEQYDEYLLGLLAEARREALTESELEETKDKQDANVRDFLNGKIDRKTWEQQSNDLNVATGALTLEYPEDYRRTLSLLGLSSEIITQIVDEDELPHMRAAQSNRLKSVFQLQFLRLSNGDFSLDPSTNVDFPPDMPDDAVRTALLQIIGTPDILSPRDMNQLGTA